METAYQQQALRSASGVELIVALYDGAIRFLYRAVRAVEERDEIDRRAAVKRALDVIMYLQARLRMDIGGSAALALKDFYTAMFTMTLEASHAESREGFEEVIACLRNVRDAWIVVAQDPDAQKIAPRDLRSSGQRVPMVAAARQVPDVAEPAASNWMA